MGLIDVTCSSFVPAAAPATRAMLRTVAALPLWPQKMSEKRKRSERKKAPIERRRKERGCDHPS